MLLLFKILINLISFLLIQPKNLLRYYGLRYITSSIEKRELALKTEKTQEPDEFKEAEKDINNDLECEEEQKKDGIGASTAYEIAASAASYLHSHTRNILPFRSSKTEDSPEASQNNVDMMNSEMASLMATTDSVTAVVAAKEEVKQAVADNLNSTRSSPCEWFVCDDVESSTRFFVIQVHFHSLLPELEKEEIEEWIRHEIAGGCHLINFKDLLFYLDRSFRMLI